jgi:hypothetical protein
VQQFKQIYGAYFAGQDLLPDGSMFVCTPMDALFCLLPLLDKARSKGSGGGMFCALDQVLTEAGAERLAPALSAVDAECICDTREAGGDLFFRLSDDRVIMLINACF